MGARNELTGTEVSKAKAKGMLGLCRYELTVDDKKESKKNPVKDRAGRRPDSINKFYFGGSPLRTQQANFTGCISNAYFTR